MGATARQCLFVSLFYHLCASASRRDALSTGYEKRYARPPEASVMLFCAQHQSRIKAARSIVYVGTELYRRFYLEQEVVSMPHAALCVLGPPCRPQPLSHAGCEGVLESHLFFALFLLSKCVFRTKDRMAERLYSLFGVGCAVLERRIGGMRSARPYGSFSILLRSLSNIYFIICA